MSTVVPVAINEVVSDVQATGLTSGIAYLPGGGLTVPGSFAANITGNDEQIEVVIQTLNSPPAGTVYGEVIDLYGTEVTYPSVPIEDPLYVKGTVAAAGTLKTDQVVVGTQGASSASVQTVPEAPSALYASSGIVSWATGTTQVVTGTAGKSIRIRGGYWAPSTAATVFCLRDSVSGEEFQFMYGASDTPWLIDLKGYALTAGADLQLVNVSGAANSGFLQILYDLY